MSIPHSAGSVTALSLVALASAIRSRSVSSVEVADSFLERIALLDPDLRAWATVDADRVRQDAADLDRRLDEQGPVGPLHGVPIGIKDLFATRGLRTSMGSRVFENNVPDADSEVVDLLRASGALVLGKTVTTEFATLDPPPTRNPWNIDHTPGGSSSGSAAAVAARMCPAATATQTVGSLGRPAAYCGLVGILPTSGRVSLNGVFPVAWSLDHAGILARSVDDACLVLNAMTRLPVPLSSDKRPPRIGVVREYFSEVTEASAWAAHERFLDELRQARVDLVELNLPPVFRYGLPALWTIMRAELASVHEAIHPVHKDTYGKTIRSLVECGMLLTSADYIRARRIRRVYQREMQGLFSVCDVVISPGAQGAAPHDISTTGEPLVQAPWTLADFPTVSLPLTITADGMPLGIQLSAPPMMETMLFAASKWMEDFIGFNGEPVLG